MPYEPDRDLGHRWQRLEGKNRVKGSITLAVLTYGLGLLRTGGDVTLPKGGALVARVVD